MLNKDTSAGKPARWPKAYRWLLLTGTALVILFLPLLPCSAAAASTPAVQVSITPARVEIAQAGEEFAVEVTVSQVDNLKGADVVVRFDPSIIQPLAVRPAGLLAGRGTDGFLPKINGQEGYVSFVTAPTGEQAVTGQGSLLSLSFRAEHEGVTALTIAQGELVDTGSHHMPVEVNHGVVVVGALPGTPGEGVQPPGAPPGSGDAGTSQPGPGDQTGGGESGLPAGTTGEDSSAADPGDNSGPHGPASSAPAANEEGEVEENGAAGSAPSAVEAAERFADVPADSWFAEAVGVLAARGIVTGYEDKTFRPRQPVSRAEFAVLVARALGLELAELPQSAPGFADAAQIPSWAQEGVAFLAASGIIQGDMAGNFRPGDNISRAEITAILIRALGLEEQTREVGEASSFTDLDQVQWARGYISLASHLGMVKGYPGGEFRPQAQATRAEASQMLLNLLGQVEQRQ